MEFGYSPVIKSYTTKDGTVKKYHTVQKYRRSRENAKYTEDLRKELTDMIMDYVASKQKKPTIKETMQDLEDSRLKYWFVSEVLRTIVE